MTIRTRLSTAVAALALAAAPAVAYAHGTHHHGHTSHTSDHAARTPIGKVASFAGGTLSITLTDGTPVTGQVTRKTVIKCDTAAPQSTTSALPRSGGGDDNDHNGTRHDDNGRHHGDDNEDASSTTPSSTEPDDNHGDDVGNGRCDSSALTADTVVRGAKISLTSKGAIWKKVVLLK